MFLLRALLYLIVVSVVAILINMEGYQLHTHAQYSEHTLTEHLQDLLTFSSCMLFLWAAKLDNASNIIGKILAALLAMMFVRESDSLLDHHVFDGAWQILVCMIFIALICSLRGQLSQIYKALKAYTTLPSYGVFLSGFITLVAFSRLMGRGSFWHSVMGEQYVRIVKNIVEEGTETLGYTLILLSAIELVISAYQKRRQTING
ncbi:hypothetical protein [Psychromonas sp. KJ10-2]|uniref:hypothetical protein n=1 Tax=Psychromonas sp. KJ10-2 TaxID=3391822 RepID=UPI0039B4F202